jgi:hypothetical protein
VLQKVINRISRQKSVSVATDLSAGEKNGRAIGNLLNIAAKNAALQKISVLNN